MKEFELDVEINGLLVRPGDSLIVSYEHHIDDEAFAVLKERFQPLIDQGLRVFLIDGAQSVHVFRPEATK